VEDRAPQIVELARRDADVQNEQRDRDREHAVAERFGPTSLPPAAHDCQFDRRPPRPVSDTFEPPVIYQHPLAYLLGLEGIALLRAFAGEYDRDFTMARLAEVRALLDAVDELGDGATVGPIPTAEGYRSWAEFYDEPGNQLIDLEQPIVWEILDGLPPGVALDAACGTGRHSVYLASLGHTVLGVDNSAAMLDRAREKVPGGEFHEADLHDLPLPDDHVDLVICALTLVHVPDLQLVLAELVRVLRPGGNMVISDQRGLIPRIGLPVVKDRPDGGPGYMPIRTRLASEYLAAALPLGLQVRRCEEPRRPFPLVDDGDLKSATGEGFPDHDPGAPPDIWALHRRAPAAANAAYRDSAAVIIWHFQLG
jgi:ubiquinone/menaquinone biosynthesis C-methylase UbiE